MIISTTIDEPTQSLVISYYDSTGNVAFIKKPLMESDLFNWVITQYPTEFRNWDGQSLKKSPSRRIHKFRFEELTQSKLSPTELSLIYSDYSPKKTYLDIEIQLTSNEFPEPELAKMPVNLITIVNENNICFVLSTMTNLDNTEVSNLTDEVNEYVKSKNQQFTVKYIYFNDEVDMLSFFFHKMLPKIPFLTGWNVISFDWLYLINRCMRLGINPMLNMPSKQLIGSSKMPVHFGLLDYMEVFQNTKPYKVVENYQLNYIAKLVLDLTKVPHEYNSMMEAQADSFNFIKYNIIDTVLIKLIEDELGLLDVAFAISKFAKIDVSRVFGAVYITETLMCREFLSRNRYVASDRKSPGEDATYAGAYVAEPIPGYYKNVACFDFASMYPNIQIQFNISPDAYLGKYEPEMVIPNDMILTKNDTLFSNKFDSAARTILTGLYDGRVRTKKEMKKLEESLKK